MRHACSLFNSIRRDFPIGTLLQSPRCEMNYRKEQSEASAVVQNMKQKVGRFLAGLSELNPSEFWDLDELRPKLESLSEMQHFRLYFALKKYFWEFDKHPTQAEALCDAGFFSKEKLPFAQRVEALDRRRRQLS
jgi:hypothetical protein